jgi:RecJ-like exonuclease
MPVTIKQVWRIIGGESDARTCKQVVILGMVSSMHSEEMDTVYEIDDGTGRIKVVEFSLDLTPPEITNGKYCHIVGRLTPKDEIAQIMAYSVRAVRDFNQIAYHALQALYVHLKHRPEISKQEIPVSREELVKQEIMKLLKQRERTGGTKRCDIITGLGKDFSIEEIDEAIENLNQNREIDSNELGLWCHV